MLVIFINNQTRPTLSKQNIKEREIKGVRERLKRKIEDHQLKIEGFENELNSIGWVSWIDDIIKPIAEEMIKSLPNRHYEILGPFGLGSTVSIHFKKTKTEDLLDGATLSISFRPVNLETGKIEIIDYSRDLGIYGKNTLGALNGFNFPGIPMPDKINDLLVFMKNKENAGD